MLNIPMDNFSSDPLEPLAMQCSRLELASPNLPPLPFTPLFQLSICIFYVHFESARSSRTRIRRAALYTIRARASVVHASKRAHG